ncbi:MAG: hypothetical protein K0R46_3243, partial [Herbinix sp.]|nr:hypothetical protein [Herbinix sp.]
MIAPIEFLQEYQNKELFLSTLPLEITDKYDVKACLKKTENKQVYIIYRKSDGMKCILKCTGIESRENLVEEYGLHHSLLHTGLVPAVEFIKKSDCGYFIREYIEGNTIAELVEMTKDGKLSDGELVDITLQLCRILKYLHSQKPPVIHRDIKPDNIIYTKQKTCKLIDFGISRRYSYEQEKDTKVLGTEYSAPPEQFGYKQTDARSDIYSIGVLMFFMATGSLDIREIDSYPISRKIK